jgi:hypothetical protein
LIEEVNFFNHERYIRVKHNGNTAAMPPITVSKSSLTASKSKTVTGRKPYDPTLGEPYNSVACEQAAWRAVIVQALMDASSNSRKKENIQWKEEALVWLRGNTRDFLTVCHYAGFEPEFVRDMAKRALERECIWRAAPGTGQKAFKTREQGIILRQATQSR